MGFSFLMRVLCLYKYLMKTWARKSLIENFTFHPLSSPPQKPSRMIPASCSMKPKKLHKTEFPGNGDRKSRIGCKQTSKMRSRMKNIVGRWEELQATGVRLKLILVSSSGFIASCRLAFYLTMSLCICFFSFSESEKGSKLDTLPEEKSHHSPSQVQPPTAIPSVQTPSNEPYRRVYPEWKPSSTLEKTDVVGTIETLAGMTCKTWRDLELCKSPTKLFLS